MIMNRSNEETKACRFDELRRDYGRAVDCIATCDLILQTLQEELALKDEELASKDKQLASKDNAIATLEEKLVQMSLELASSQAFEDEHRARRRSPNPDTDSDGSSDVKSCPLSSQPPSKNNLLERAKSMPEASDTASTDMHVEGKPSSPSCRQKYCGKTGDRKNRTLDDSSYSSRSFDFGLLFRRSKTEDDFIDNSQSDDWPEEDDAPSRRLSNFGQFFRMNQIARETKASTLQQEFPKVENRENDVDMAECPRRRPANRRRTMMSQPSTESLIGSRVIFPVTFEDCVGGCDKQVSLNH